ncbi:MAG: hypothetical protein V3V61_01150 [Gammaproteobacteria bacterium]
MIIASQKDKEDQYQIYFKRKPDKEGNSEIAKEIITKENKPKLYSLIDKYSDKFKGTKLMGTDRQSKNFIKSVNEFIKLKGGLPLDISKNKKDKEFRNDAGYSNFPVIEKIWLHPSNTEEYNNSCNSNQKE